MGCWPMRKAITTVMVFMAIIGMAVTPAMGADIGGVEKGLTGGAGGVAGFVRYSTPDYVTDYDEGPGFYVHFEDGEYSSLQDWADSSDQREIKYSDNGSDYALVAMPAGHTGASTVDRILGNGLLAKGYVEFIDVNVDVEVIEPVSLKDEGEAWAKPGNRLTRFGYNDQFTSEGVGFDGDTNETTLGDSINKTNPDASYTGAGVRVAVLDTGINTYDGRVFGNGTAGSSLRIVQAKNFVTDENGTSANNFDNVSDGANSMHGTWVSAAIAGNHSNATYQGVAPNADLLVGKVLADDGSGDMQDVVRGIEWASDHNADIISMSLGSMIYSPTVAHEVEEFLDNGGKAVILAAGNNRQTTRYLASPSDIPQQGVVTVAASTPEKAPNALSMYFSAVGPDHGIDGSRLKTRGQEPDIAAPGANITANIPNTHSSLVDKTLSGTSMATPIVAGHVALYLEAHPNTDTSDIVSDMDGTASPMPKAGVTEVGAGMIDGTNFTARNNRSVTQEGKRNSESKNRDVANRAFSNDQRGFWASMARRAGV